MRKGLLVLLSLAFPEGALTGQDSLLPPATTSESARGAEAEGRAKEPEEKAVELEKVRKSRLPALPVWSPNDYEKLKRGEIVAGQNFFAPVPIDPDATIEPPVVELPKPVEESSQPEEDETAISAEHMAEYFREIPRDGRGEPIFLNDPQDLLSQQEFRDRESFLHYHSSESNIDMFVYLFDQRQEFPVGTDIQTVYGDLYAKHGPVALVFYHLGAPDRSQFFLCSDIRAVISQEEQDRALRAAVQEAFEKSDVADQLEDFLVELSIRLYWIERELKAATATSEARRLESGNQLIPVSGGNEEDNLRLIGQVVLFALCVILAGLLGWAGLLWLQHRRKYRFPEVECGPLLGAPHAAGVGAVICFSNAHLPPSRQRDQVPDYLDRM